MINPFLIGIFAAAAVATGHIGVSSYGEHLWWIWILQSFIWVLNVIVRIFIAKQDYDIARLNRRLEELEDLT